MLSRYISNKYFMKISFKNEYQQQNVDDTLHFHIYFHLITCSHAAVIDLLFCSISLPFMSYLLLCVGSFASLLAVALSVCLSQHFIDRKHFCTHNWRHIASPFRLTISSCARECALHRCHPMQGNRLRNKKCQLLSFPPLYSCTKIEEDFLSWLDIFGEIWNGMKKGW